MIRKINISDVPRVAEIHVLGWRSAYRGIVSDEFLFSEMLVSKRIHAFERAVHDHSDESYVYDDGIVKAILTIGACRDADKMNSFELWGIYVDPFMWRQGIGSKMVDFCESEAINRGYSEVCLWVFEKNTDARIFYEKCGYILDGMVKFNDKFKTLQVRYIKYF